MSGTGDEDAEEDEAKKAAGAENRRNSGARSQKSAGCVGSGMKMRHLFFGLVLCKYVQVSSQLLLKLRLACKQVIFIVAQGGFPKLPKYLSQSGRGQAGGNSLDQGRSVTPASVVLHRS